MKFLKLLFVFVSIGSIFSSCTQVYEDDFRESTPSLEQVVSGYDLWYVDYHKTIGIGDVPYVSQAFTLSFLKGVLYANNNIADLGFTGNGFGIDIGTYDTFSQVLQTRHDIDGLQNFDVTVLAPDRIRLYSYEQNTTYFLEGYQRDTFDYHQLFYENIEYFLQEYEAWEKASTIGGIPNIFDVEHYLKFTPENTTTFYSSKDDFGTQVADVFWDYSGNYEVFDVVGFEDLKIITLHYSGGTKETFELSVINDHNIRLYSLESGATYDFEGFGFIPYLKGEERKKNINIAARNAGRKRMKVERKSKIRRSLK
jgi:hypothetical protein